MRGRGRDIESERESVRLRGRVGRGRGKGRGNGSINSKNPFAKATFILRVRIPTKTTSFLFDAAIIIKNLKVLQELEKGLLGFIGL